MKTIWPIELKMKPSRSKKKANKDISLIRVNDRMYTIKMAQIGQLMKITMIISVMKAYNTILNVKFAATYGLMKPTLRNTQKNIIGQN